MAADRPGVHRQADEADFLLNVFTPWGFHVERPLDVSDEGPWEGRTIAPNGDLARQVFNDNPFADPEGSEWYGANRDWRAPEKFH